MKENKTHWLSSPNKNYLGHWDLPENGELVLTIKSAAFEEVKNPTNGQKQIKKVIHWAEAYKPMIVNQTNSKAIYKSTGCKYLEDSQDHKIVLFISQVMNRLEGEMVDCIRVKPYKYTEPKKTKESLSDARLNDAIKAIKKGTFTIDVFKNKYALTDGQIAKLDKELS